MLKSIDAKILDPRLLSPEFSPKYATSGSAGMDMRACIDAPLTLAPGETQLIPSGLAIHIGDPNYAAFFLSRSGLGVKKGVNIAQSVGLIDADYQNQMFIPLHNRGAEPYTIQPMERVCQMVIMPVVQVELNIVEAFAASERGLGGFGSTGSA